jgi:D-alanine-D-alanine ligase
LLEADTSIFGKLRENGIDIVFNIAEGTGGRGREAQIPAIMNFLGIPYAGSDETTLAIALDKALAKRLLATHRIRTPKYRIVSGDAKKWSSRFTFPAIVKPNAEGSSKGISDAAIVRNGEELRKLVSNNIRLYKQDMLIEEYIGGREFTVGIVGNGDETKVFAPMEIVYLDRKNPFNIYSYNVKQNYKELIKYECPAKISPETEREIMDTARKIFDALSCKDFSRIDFRLSPDGLLYFIEINPLPGLAPGYSDFPMLAEFSGVPYAKLVRSIMNSALKRYGMHCYVRQE